jgi:hypothetical protein
LHPFKKALAGCCADAVGVHTDNSHWLDFFFIREPLNKSIASLAFMRAQDQGFILQACWLHVKK